MLLSYPTCGIHIYISMKVLNAAMLSRVIFFYLKSVNFLFFAQYINFLSHFLAKLHIKFGLDWPCGFREDV